MLSSFLKGGRCAISDYRLICAINRAIATASATLLGSGATDKGRSLKIMNTFKAWTWTETINYFINNRFESNNERNSSINILHFIFKMYFRLFLLEIHKCVVRSQRQIATINKLLTYVLKGNWERNIMQYCEIGWCYATSRTRFLRKHKYILWTKNLIIEES